MRPRTRERRPRARCRGWRSRSTTATWRTVSPDGGLADEPRAVDQCAARQREARRPHGERARRGPGRQRRDARGPGESARRPLMCRPSALRVIAGGGSVRAVAEPAAGAARWRSGSPSRSRCWPSCRPGTTTSAASRSSRARLRLLRAGAPAARALPLLPRVGLAVFGVALAARAALLPVPPSLSGDLYRYLWEGRVVSHGGDPYRQSPRSRARAAPRPRGVSARQPSASSRRSIRRSRSRGSPWSPRSRPPCPR